MAYEIRKGDTLSDIARRAGMDVRDLIAQNPQFKNPNLIRPGEKVRVTGRPSSPKAREAAARKMLGISGSYRGAVDPKTGKPVDSGAAQAQAALQQSGWLTPSVLASQPSGGPVYGAGSVTPAVRDETPNIQSAEFARSRAMRDQTSPFLRSPVLATQGPEPTPGGRTPFGSNYRPYVPPTAQMPHPGLYPRATNRGRPSGIVDPTPAVGQFFRGLFDGLVSGPKPTQGYVPPAPTDLNAIEDPELRAIAEQNQREMEIMRTAMAPGEAEIREQYGLTPTGAAPGTRAARPVPEGAIGPVGSPSWREAQRARRDADVPSYGSGFIAGTPTELRAGLGDAWYSAGYLWTEEPAVLEMMQRGITPYGPANQATQGIANLINEFGVWPAFFTPWTRKKMGLTDAELQAAGYIFDPKNNYWVKTPTSPVAAVTAPSEPNYQPWRNPYLNYTPSGYGGGGGGSRYGSLGGNDLYLWRIGA